MFLIFRPIFRWTVLPPLHQLGRKCFKTPTVHQKLKLIPIEKFERLEALKSKAILSYHCLYLCWNYGVPFVKTIYHFLQLQLFSISVQVLFPQFKILKRLLGVAFIWTSVFDFKLCTIQKEVDGVMRVVELLVRVQEMR